MGKISVIIPVYEVEKYLPCCLDSVINQTLNDLEIICVNDASPDNSAAILEEYARRDSRIKILTHEHNQGLGPARNTGVAHATSPYIAFVDSDDYIAPNMMEVLYHLITSNNADMAWGAMAKVSEAGLLIDKGQIPEGIWSALEVLNCEQLFPSLQVMCNKLFCRKYMKGIKQLPILIEDEPAIAEYLAFCKRIVTTGESIYFYRHTPESLSNPSTHKLEYWDQFFNDYSLYFSILRKHFSNPDILRKQLILRHRALLWRINTYRLPQSDTWKAQERRILLHLNRDGMDIKSTCPLMHKYLTLLFRSTLSPKLKDFMLKLALKLSQKMWIKRCSFWLLPIDISKVLIPVIKMRIKKIFVFLEICSYRILAKLYKIFNKKNIWIVGERRDTAQENGFYFYRYIKQNYSQEVSYYIIDKKCKQYEMVKPFGNIVQFDSIFHRILFFACQYYVTAHYNLCFPTSIFDGKPISLPQKSMNVFLDHGITYADVTDYHGKRKSNISLFICGARPEFEFVKKNLGYVNADVSYTGFARFDGLHSFKKKKQILLMPTWRRDIIYSSTASSYFVKTQQMAFMNSHYYKELQQLINRPDLHELLEEYGYRLVFSPHYEVQKHLNCFTSCNNRISIVSKDEHLVQDLLKESALLIVDTSSVSFDFAYMFKPVIYYYFDKEIFDKNHLKPSYFKHESMGFGRVIKQQDKLLEVIATYLQSDCRMEPVYRERVKAFYPLYDQSNCARIFQAISERK